MKNTQWSQFEQLSKDDRPSNHESWPSLGDFEGFEENIWETDNDESEEDGVIHLGSASGEESSQGDSEISGRDEEAVSGDEKQDNDLLVDMVSPALEISELSSPSDSLSSEGEARENIWTVEARPDPPLRSKLDHDALDALSQLWVLSQGDQNAQCHLAKVW